MLYRVHLSTNGAYSGCCLSILKEISTYILPFHSLLSTFILFYLLCLAPLSAIFSAISWRPVLVVEEAAVPGDKPTMDKQLVNLITCAASRVHHFCKIQSQARTRAVLVIGLYEL